MANSNLGAAKKAKNDEFYTQYLDIQKEIEAYLEFDKGTFKNKIVYCNCDDPFESNFFRYFVLNFNRLGLKKLITTSYKPSPIANTELILQPSFIPGYDDKVINKPDDPKGRAKVTANKFIISDVGDVNEDGQFNLTDIAEKLKTNKNNEWEPLEGEGDFRSAECIELLNQSDIVVTNPPFSLFREYIKQLSNYDKKFLVIGNMNAITYKEVFPLIKSNKVWIGPSINSGDREFLVPKDYARNKQAVRTDNEGNEFLRVNGVRWFTNLDHGRRHQPLSLRDTRSIFKRPKHKVFEGKVAFDHYDNYDAIEVPFTDSIPNDYNGVMGVPISFLNKYNPDQFEILGMCENEDLYKMKTRVYTTEERNRAYFDKFGKKGSYDLNASGVLVVNGRYEKVYQRILIRHRKAIK